MYQEFTNSEARARNNSLMGADTISKNGRNPKSQMSRRKIKIMRNSLLLFVATMLFSITSAFAAITFNFNNGTLTIGGTGTMIDYNSTGSSAPWYEHKNSTTKIIIENGVTSIGANAFIEWTAVQSLVFNANINLTSIGKNAFKGCSNLNTPLIIPESQQLTIGEGAFQDCIKLPSLIIPTSVKEIDKNAFYGCNGLQIVTIKGTTTPLILTSNSSTGGHFNCSIDTLDLGRNINQGNTTNGVFAENSKLKQVTIRENVSIINSKCFENCTELQTLVFDNVTNLTDIKSKAFNGCGKLETPLNIPPSSQSTTIGESAFQNCKKLPSLIIPTSVKEIDKNAFYGCNGLQIVTIKGTTTPLILTSNSSTGGHFNCSIDTLDLGRNINQGNTTNGVFAENSKLKQVTIRENVSIINSKCFENCTELQTLVFDNVTNLIDIKSKSFNGCGKLETPLNIPPSSQSTTIGESAFQNCIKLPSLIIPTSVKEIDKNAFKDCNGLRIVKIKGTTTTTALKLTSNSSIGDHFNCSIDTLYLDRNIDQGNTTNGIFAGNLGLKHVTIGENVTKINNNCFLGCSNINVIYSLRCPPPAVSNNTFTGIDPNVPIYCNCTCLETYRTVWNYFSNFQCDVPPIIKTTTLPNGTVGAIYNQTIEVTGSIPIAWVQSGSLPTGLTFSDGNISGTPTTAGKFDFTVTATNDAGSDTKSLSIEIKDVVSVFENEMKNINVYPNPTTGELIIDNEQFTINNTEYIIFNLTGQMVLQGKLQGETTTINVESLPSGMYFLRIGEKAVKFVKE